MPDWFETRFGMNAKVASSNQDSDKDGFTDLQEYTQGLITGFNIGGAKPEATINAVKGAETFKLAKDGTPAVIKGFDLAEGDKIDLSRLLTDFRDGVDDRNNFVEVTSIAGSTMISVDRDGTASKYGWEFVVELAGVKDAAGVSTAIIPKGDAHPILGLSRVQQTGISGDEQPDRLSGTAGNDTIFGNGGNDKLYGLGGADTLVGGDGDDWLEGGTGADLMYGGSGNDHYVVDSALDMVIEENARGNDAGGRDTVRASISYQLGDNIENLILTGSASISGAGNTLANTLTGNDGANVMTGGDGNDSIRGNAGDDLLRGDAGADLLRGDAGNDTLIGGAGADTLSGGAGRDSFVFDHFPTDGSVDQITDFNVADDEIVIVRAGFKGLGGIEAGAIDAGMLHIGSAATTAEHRFIYDAARGNFLFDADGAGAEAAQLIARIGRVSGLSHDDIMLV
jgi:Ca2+-binding RTX toxin-like protein